MALRHAAHSIIFCRDLGIGIMYGVIIAFKDYSPAFGILGSPWVGLKHFVRRFLLPIFSRDHCYTLRLSLYSLLVSVPLPIILGYYSMN